jgi:hypothetical protein
VLLCVGPGRRVGNVVGYALSVRIVHFDVVSSGRSSESRCDGCDSMRGRLHQLAYSSRWGSHANAREQYSAVRALVYLFKKAYLYGVGRDDIKGSVVLERLFVVQPVLELIP